MNKWVLRIAALLMLLIFGLIFTQMYKTLVALQRSQRPPATKKSP